MKRRHIISLTACALVALVVTHRGPDHRESVGPWARTIQQQRWQHGARASIDLGGPEAVAIRVEPTPPPRPLPAWSRRLANLPAHVPPPTVLPPLRIDVPTDALPEKVKRRN